MQLIFKFILNMKAILVHNIINYYMNISIGSYITILNLTQTNLPDMM